MADRETWARRVAEWKASGLSSPAFCAGKEFTAGGLRHWAYRLQHGVPQRKPRVRIARVVRTMPTGGTLAAVADGASEVIVEVGGARIAVRPGFDRDTVAALVEMLASRSGR